MTKYNEFENDDYLLKANRLNIESLEELAKAEAFAFAMRSMQIEQKMYQITSFTLNDFMKLHEHLFQDIYPFAGQFRNVQLMKGSTRFCQVEYLHTYAEKLFQEITNENDWHTLEIAADRMAYFKAELNMLHPFREGNGRTTRIFLQAFAKSQNYFWAYEQMDRDAYLTAMIQSVTHDDLLRALFMKTLSQIE